MLKGLYILDPAPYTWIYGPAEREDIEALVSIYAPAQTKTTIKDNPGVLRDAEVIFSGWGAPEFTSELLDALPCLKAIF